MPWCSALVGGVAMSKYYLSVRKGEDSLANVTVTWLEWKILFKKYQVLLCSAHKVYNAV